MAKPAIIKTYELLSEFGFFDAESPVLWITRLNQMYERGWLYLSFKGDELMSVAGAYRVEDWKDSYLRELPDEERGTILFISFFATKSDRLLDPLRLLRQYLIKNPGINEIVYFKKYWNVASSAALWPEKKRLLIRNYGPQVIKPKKRVEILPPELLPAGAF